MLPLLSWHGGDGGGDDDHGGAGAGGEGGGGEGEGEGGDGDGDGGSEGTHAVTSTELKLAPNRSQGLYPTRPRKMQTLPYLWNVNELQG